MSRRHLCISGRAGQLQRWQEAFPLGRILAPGSQLDRWIMPDSIIWLHLDYLAQKDLSQTCEHLLNTYPRCRLIAISSVPEPGAAMDCLKLGINGYCHALAVPALLHQVSAVVSNGGYWLGEDLIQRLVGTLERNEPSTQATDPTNPLTLLSSREQQVALQVQKGSTNKEIALSLAITERTVKAHLGSIFQKLDIRDRLQLVLLLQNKT